MSYINCGAYVAGRRPATKAALKRALLDSPESVTFDPTSFLGAQPDAPLTGVSIPAGVRLSVVGPDPFTKRAWYGTVSVAARTGRVTVA